MGGGIGNTVPVGPSATVGGGGGNTASDRYATVGGGYANTAGNPSATVGGGSNNTANGDFATVGGGTGNTVPGGGSATVGGGAYNTAGGNHATVPGGVRALASHYGEMAYASGMFTNDGDAQTSLYVLHNTTSDATQTELFLDGSSERLTIATNRVMTFDILVVATEFSGGGGNSAGYQIKGVIKNIAGNTRFVAAPLVTVLAEDTNSWDASVTADDTYDALLIKVIGSAETTIRWVAFVRTVEVEG